MTRKCICFRAVKLLDHGMKVVKMVLGERLHRMVYVDELQFGLISERGTIDAVFILRRMQEECHAKGIQVYMCFADIKLLTEY